MGTIAAWILLGLIAGALARFIIPGQKKGGWFTTLILGILGAVVGGWIAREIGFLPPADPGIWIPGIKSIGSATVGAIILLAIWRGLLT